jgi:hypothetical protein
VVDQQLNQLNQEILVLMVLEMLEVIMHHRDNQGMVLVEEVLVDLVKIIQITLVQVILRVV